MTRIVVTGLGAVTPIGNDVPTFWRSLTAGVSGAGPVTAFDATGFPVRIACEVKDFDPLVYMDRKLTRRTARPGQFALAVARQAVADADLDLGAEDTRRVGIVIGTGGGGITEMEDGTRCLSEKGPRGVSPFFVTSVMPNSPSCLVSIELGTCGPVIASTAACASGNMALWEALRLLQWRDANVVIAEGVEAIVSPLFFAAFARMGALSCRNDDPQRASRPFDAERDGFVYSEGGALLILETLEHARARGARIRAEMLGHASSSDAFHVAQPDPEGMGASRAMRWALDDAGLTPDGVDYINAHGSSTPISDPIETRAIKRVFGERAYEIPISSTKSMIGHAMGGAGAIEAAACVLTVEQGIIHPTINLETPDPECDLDYVPEGARKADVRFALSNSFGLGGQNACLVLGRFEE